MSSAERQGRRRRGPLTSPGSVHNFPFGAGLLVLQVIVQEHFPQQVALPRQINVTSLPTPRPALERNKAEHPPAAAGRALPAWVAGAAWTRSGAGRCHGAVVLVLTLSPYLFLFTSICCSVLSTLMHSFSSVSMRSLVCCTSLAQQSHRHAAERDKGVPKATAPPPLRSAGAHQDAQPTKAEGHQPFPALPTTPGQLESILTWTGNLRSRTAETPPSPP